MKPRLAGETRGADDVDAGFGCCGTYAAAIMQPTFQGNACAIIVTVIWTMTRIDHAGDVD
jgi:hypothetical protein